MRSEELVASQAFQQCGCLSFIHSRWDYLSHLYLSLLRFMAYFISPYSKNICEMAHFQSLFFGFVCECLQDPDPWR